MVQKKQRESGKTARYEEINLKYFLAEFPLADVEIQIPVGWNEGVDYMQAEYYPRIHCKEFKKIQEAKLTDFFQKELREKRNIRHIVLYTCDHEMFIDYP